MDLPAHRESYYNGHVLHRDISAGNIVIYNNGGLLIDWDMSKDLDLISDDKTISRTVGYASRILDSCAYHLFRYFQGTWAFQSLRLSKRPKKNQAQPIHGRLDDLESFYHVLFWVSLQHARHELNPDDLYDILTRLFDHAVIGGDKAYSNFSKRSHMKSDDNIETAGFENRPLLRLLRKLSVAFKVLYIAAPDPDIIDPPAKNVQRTRESYQKELGNYNEELRFLSSDEDPNWMEVYFKQALDSSDDAWGPTEYQLNKITPPVATMNTKRKYTDMRSSDSRYYNQGGTFLSFDQNAEEDEGQDATENEGEDVEHYDEEHSDGGENDEENDQRRQTRRRRY
jgi:serine/threonine protein kinase